jgi:hypothetical protein
MFSVLQAGTSGLIESFAQVAMIGATLVLLLMLVALGGFAYKSLRGDGIEWPDDVDAEERDGAVKGGDDDEWDYY